METLKIAGGEYILASEQMMGKDIKTATDKEVQTEKEHFKAICFILRADEGRFKKLLDDLKSSANRGRDEYPTTLTSALDLLVRESGEYDQTTPCSRFNPRGGGRGRFGRGRGRSSVMFTQAGRGRGRGRGEQSTRTNDSYSEEIVPGDDGVSHPTVKCFGCNFMGHYCGECQYKTETGIVSAHLKHLLTQDSALFNIPNT